MQQEVAGMGHGSMGLSAILTPFALASQAEMLIVSYIFQLMLKLWLMMLMRV